MSQARLYGVGVGPGDPELLTLKALRVVGECPVIAVPVSRKGSGGEGGDKGEGTIALGIMKKALHGLGDKEILRLYFPMTRDRAVLSKARKEAAQEVARRLEEGLDVAFLTLGDPTLYSTFTNLVPLLSGLAKGVEVLLVPGVTSVSASAARAGLTLAQAGERLLVAPAFYDLKALARWCEDFDTVVLMKVKSRLPDIRRFIDERAHESGNGGKAAALTATFVERAGWQDREVIMDLADLDESYRPSYLSMVILKRAEREGP